MVTHAIEVESGNTFKNHYEFDIESDNFDEFKYHFLRHFGNFTGAVVVARKEKPKVNRAIHEAKSLDDLLEAFKQAEYWSIKTKEVIQ